MPLPDGATLMTFLDVTASANVERALTERNEALVGAEKLRNDFVKHVSYELRTPLTNIIGFTQLLADGGAGPLNAKQLEYAGYITSSSAALLAIINDILDLASIDAGALELRLEDVDVAEAMKAAAEGVQDRLQRGRIELRIVATDGVGRCAPTGGASDRSVQSALQRDRLLRGRSDGDAGGDAPGRRGRVQGLRSRSRHSLPRRWSACSTASKARRAGSRHRGPGLGLSIVRALVELHGGRVTIDSALGEGTTVTCFFPVRAAQRAGERGRLTMAVGRTTGRRSADETIDLPRGGRHDRARAMARAASPARATSSRFRGDLGAGKTTFARALSARGDGRARARGAEPDLHAAAGLRGPGISRRPRRFLSVARRRGAEPDWAGTRRSRAPSRWSNGRSAPPTRCRPDRLEIALFFDAARGDEFRRAELRGPRRRWRRASSARARSRLLLESAGWADARRAPLHGDASTRAYERLTAPRRRDGDPHDLAAARERPDAAFRQVLRGNRAALGGHPRLSRHGGGPARARLFDAAHSCSRHSPTVSR